MPSYGAPETLVLACARKVLFLPTGLDNISRPKKAKKLIRFSTNSMIKGDKALNMNDHNLLEFYIKIINASDRNYMKNNCHWGIALGAEKEILTCPLPPPAKPP
jgi:hypothetical protein